jgi:hypothetical protein
MALNCLDWAQMVTCGHEQVYQWEIQDLDQFGRRGRKFIFACHSKSDRAEWMHAVNSALPTAMTDIERSLLGAEFTVDGNYIDQPAT